MKSSSEFTPKNSPRLIDYIAFVGQKNPSRTGRHIAEPELLRVYPPQNHPDFALPSDIVYFCQPKGCYKTSSRTFVSDPLRSGSHRPQNVKMEFLTFTLTDKESNTVRYGVCLNFLRPIGRHKTSYTADVTRRRIASFKNALHNRDSKPDTNRIHSCETPLDSSSSSNSDGFIGAQSMDKSDRPFTHTLTSICLVSSYQFFKKFEKCLRFLYVIIQKLHEGCKPRLSGRETVWSVLTGTVKNSELLTIQKSIEEIDTWILRLLSLPAPIPGKTAIHAYLQPLDPVTPITFALPDENRFSVVDYSLCLPLKLLGVEKFLKVFFSLLLEQKVVLESSYPNQLTTCVMAFTALCYPLQYLFTVIPLLPSSLKGAEQILQAPSPYIIGLPRNFRDSRPSFHLPKDVLLVDLDTHELYGQGAQEQVPKLPIVEERKLVSQLNKVLASLQGIKGEVPEEREKKGPAFNRRSSHTDSELFDQLASNLDEESLNLAIRVAMVLFFNSPNVLGGFSQHTRTVRIYPRPVVAFQYERFMKSRPEPSAFTVVLAKTQAVEYFAEWSLMPDNLAYLRVHKEAIQPSDIGDRDKWFAKQLEGVHFSLWTERFDRGLLRPVVEHIFASSGVCSGDMTYASEWTVGRHLSIKASPSVTLSSTSGACEIGTTSESDTPTDVSASNGDSHDNTDGEHFTDLESGFPDEIKIEDMLRAIFQGDEASVALPPSTPTTTSRGALFNTVVLSNSDKVEFMRLGEELPPNLRAFYTPPTAFEIPSEVSGRTPSMPSNQESLSSGLSLAGVTRPTTSPEPVPPLPTSEDPTRQESTADSANSSRRPSSQTNQPSQKIKSTFGAIIDNWFADALQAISINKALHDMVLGFTPLLMLTTSGRPSNNVSDEEARRRRQEMAKVDNDHFVRECVAGIKQGNQPGIRSRRRFQKLMEEEVFRNVALSCANGNVGQLVPPSQRHVSDVFLDSWDEYKAYVWLFAQIGAGVRQSCRPLVTTFLDSRGDVVSPTGLASAFRDLFGSAAERERVAPGGVGSAASLLEMAHTHFHLLPRRRTSTTATFPASTPQSVSSASGSGRQRGPMVAAASVPTSPLMSFNSTILKKDSQSNGLSEERQKSCITDSSHFNVIKSDEFNSLSSQPLTMADRKSKPLEVDGESALINSTGISMEIVEDVVQLPPFKSALSLGYRYRHGRLFQTADEVSPQVETRPPCISVPALRSNLIERRSESALTTPRRNAGESPVTSEATGAGTPSIATSAKEAALHTPKPEQLRSRIGHTYLFEEAMVNAVESKLWTNMQFWEDLFLDMITQERQHLGMEFDPVGQLEHYKEQKAEDQKRLELGEDALLATALHNTVAFMVLARLPPDLVRRKARRLVAKSHTGLHFSQQINNLLDSLEWLRGNDIDLLPLASRQAPPAIFTAGKVQNDSGLVDACSMVIYRNFILIRMLESGEMWRLWFDQIVNVVNNAQSICLQVVQKNSNKVLNYFTANHIEELFHAIASALDRARLEKRTESIIDQLGGYVNIIDADTGAPGKLEMNPGGMRVTLNDQTKFLQFKEITRCTSPGTDLFSVFVKDNDQGETEWKLKTDMASVLMTQFKRLVAVHIMVEKKTGGATPISSRSRTSSFNNPEASLFDR